MSAIEFILASVVSLPVLFAGHEFSRLYATQHAVEIVVHDALARATSSALQHISRNSFPEHNRAKTLYEQQLQVRIESLLQRDLFQWRWLTDLEHQRDSLLSVSVSATGPNIQSPTKTVRISVKLCVSTWLESFMVILNDGRTCVGHFSSKGRTRGMTLHIEGQRDVSVHIPVYFYGLYTHADK